MMRWCITTHPARFITHHERPCRKWWRHLSQYREVTVDRCQTCRLIKKGLHKEMEHSLCPGMPRDEHLSSPEYQLLTIHEINESLTNLYLWWKQMLTSKISSFLETCLMQGKTPLEFVLTRLNSNRWWQSRSLTKWTVKVYLTKTLKQAVKCRIIKTLLSVSLRMIGLLQWHR